MLLLEIHHQNNQAVLGTTGMNGLRCISIPWVWIMHVCSYPYFMKIAVLNPFHAEATFVHGRNMQFWNPTKPCNVGIHWKAHAEYYQMSTHMPGFRSFFSFLASFCIDQIKLATSSQRVKVTRCLPNRFKICLLSKGI